MGEPTVTPEQTIAPTPRPQTAIEALLHRWFVQYNPFYLLSAALVLAGLTMISGAMKDDASVWGIVGVGLLSELYAIALIGGAALLTRIGSPRPAVFVALIAILYQGDLTLGTETWALLGGVGKVATLVWPIVFVAKLRALAWALELKLSPSAIAVPSFGAIGVALVPQLARRLDAHDLTVVVALFLFGMVAAALWSNREVTSRRDLDAWGRTVLSRAIRATWVIFGCLVAAHILFWRSQYKLDGMIGLPVFMLLGTRWIRREAGVVAYVSVTLLYIATSMPAFLPVSALMGAIVLSLFALRRPVDPSEDEAASPPRDDYRVRTEPEVRASALRFVAAQSPDLWRQLGWAAYARYLSAWTFGWRGGALPHHVALCELAISAAIAWIVWRSRSRVVVLPLVATYLHWSIQSRLVRAPQSPLQWGLASFALGFTMLLGSLFASWRLSRVPTLVLELSDGSDARP